MAAVAAGAEQARGARRPVSANNPLLAWENAFSQWLTLSLNTWRDVRDAAVESVFFATYGNPLTQALLGLGADEGPPRRHPGTSPEHRALMDERAARLRAAISEGGVREAAIRALIYVRMPTELVDERGFGMLRHIHETEGGDLTLAEFKQLVREQFFMLLLDERAAIEALPGMIAGREKEAKAALERLRKVATASDTMNDEAWQRFEEMATVFAPGTAGAKVEQLPRRREAAEG
jgi:hypothetical protein